MKGSKLLNSALISISQVMSDSGWGGGWEYAV